MNRILAGAGAVYAVLAFAILFPADVSAQSRYVQIAREYDHPLAFHQVVVVPGADSAQALVVFRIPNSLLVFVQQDGAFVAGPEVAVTLYRDGRTVDERIWRGRQTAPSFDATQSRVEDVEGAVLFRLAPGSYAYELSLSDDVSGSVGTARRRPFEVTDFARTSLGMPFFARVGGRDNGRMRLQPANLGGDVPFGERMPLLIPVGAVEPGDRLTYRLFQVDVDKRERTPRADYGLEDSGRLVSEGRIAEESLVHIGKIDPSCLCWQSDDDGVLVRADIPTESLENDAYVLEVTLQRGEERHASTLSFSTLWRDMPLSLYDPELAIRNLEFIASRDVVRTLLRGSRNARIEKFRSFWQQRDPTPETVYNELMAEYYRRVDVAARQFQTGRTPYPDGLQTDAAEVYIVHGPPDDVASSFPSSGGVEQIWTYPDGRQFVFWAASSLDALELQEERSPKASGN